MKCRAALLGAAALLALTSPASASRFTAWYFGVDGGANWEQDIDALVYATPGPVPVASSAFDFSLGWAAFAEAGYAFDNNWRVELEGGYRNNQIDTFTPVAGVAAPLSGELGQYTLMANVLYDFTSSSGLMLSVGGGVGADYARANSAAAAPLLVPFKGDDISLAFQALLGVSYPITSWMDLTLNYRYLYVTDIKLTDNDTAAPNVDHIDSTGPTQDHTVTLGLRFGGRAPDRPVAVAKAAPPPPPPPAAAIARQYVVYFGFNKCSITAEADSVLTEAAAATRRLGQVTVKIVGHTDTVGSKAANQILSECRAEATKSNMISKGVPAGTIMASGVGETQLMIQTRDNVKEPQNRRATVDLD